MSIPNKAKGTLRTLKNMTFNYSDVQIKVREATSNNPVGPNANLLSEISRATFTHHTFMEVMEIIDKRLDDAGKQWRHVFKSLVVMEYLVHHGSDESLKHFKANLYRIKTLREFQYIDDQSRDQGANVRHKAAALTDLLTDDAKLKELRKNIRSTMSDYGNGSNYANGGGFGSTGYANDKGYGQNDYGSSYGTGKYGNSSYGYGDEDRDLQLAIEESKRMAAPSKPQPVIDNGDKDLQYALEISKREAEQERLMREQSIAKENELVLLEDYDPTPKPNNPATQHIKQYDFFGNIIHDPQPSQSTSGTADLLGLDPLAFSSHNSSSFNQNSYNQQNFAQSNPFTQMMPMQTQNSNIFQVSPQPQKAATITSPPSGFDSQFNKSFDGGFKAKLLPHQKVNNANSALAEIARNSSKIDPFASFAAERANSPVPSGSMFNSDSPGGNRIGQSNTVNSNPFQSNSNTNNNLFANNSPMNNQTSLFSNTTPSNPPASLNIFDAPASNNNQNSNPFGNFQNSNQQQTPNNNNLFQSSNNQSNGQPNIFF